MYFYNFLIFTIFFSINLFSNFLDQKLPEIIQTSKKLFEDLPNRDYEDVILNTKKFKDIRFSISYPKNVKNNENILIILDGLETGRNVLKYLPNLDNFIMIGYEYTKDIHRLTKKSVFLHLPSTRKAVLDVPFQILGIIEWVKKQPWGNKNVMMIGVSFGAIFVPATYHLAELNNIKLSNGIIAFGGANLYDIFKANLNNYKIFKVPLAYFADLIFKPIDPIYHLPFMHGNFLIINGKNDKRIPLKSAHLLQKLTPEPKTIINLDTPHVEPDREAIINEVVKISLKWLEKNTQN